MVPNCFNMRLTSRLLLCGDNPRRMRTGGTPVLFISKPWKGAGNDSEQKPQIYKKTSNKKKTTLGVPVKFLHVIPLFVFLFYIFLRQKNQKLFSPLCNRNQKKKENMIDHLLRTNSKCGWFTVILIVLSVQNLYFPLYIYYLQPELSQSLEPSPYTFNLKNLNKKKNKTFGALFFSLPESVLRRRRQM